MATKKQKKTQSLLEAAAEMEQTVTKEILEKEEQTTEDPEEVRPPAMVKRDFSESELEKLDNGSAVLQDTTALGLGASKNGHILERKVR